MMSSMRSWHMRNIISHNLLLVMFIRLQHTCSTLHYTALHHSTGVTADPPWGAGGSKGKFWFPSLTPGGAGCIFGWRVTSSKESLMMIKQAPSNCSVSSFICSNSISCFLWCHRFSQHRLIGGNCLKLIWQQSFIVSLPPTPWQKWIVIPNGQTVSLCALLLFKFVLVLASLPEGEVTVKWLCFVSCGLSEVNKEWAKPGRRHFLSVFTFTGSRQPQPLEPWLPSPVLHSLNTFYVALGSS